MKAEFEPKTISIEQAKPEHTEVIYEIRDEAWIDTYPNEELGITAEDIRLNAQGLNGEFVPKRNDYLRRKIAENGEDWRAYVAKIDGVVRGFVIASTDEDGRKILNSLYVKPGYQGKGIGKELMGQALSYLGNDKDIYLEVTSYNERAIKFYEKFGFKKTDTDVPEEQGRPSYMKSIPQIEMVLRVI